MEMENLSHMRPMSPAGWNKILLRAFILKMPRYVLILFTGSQPDQIFTHRSFQRKGASKASVIFVRWLYIRFCTVGRMVHDGKEMVAIANITITR